MLWNIVYQLIRVYTADLSMWREINKKTINFRYRPKRIYLFLVRILKLIIQISYIIFNEYKKKSIFSIDWLLLVASINCNKITNWWTRQNIIKCSSLFGLLENIASNICVSVTLSNNDKKVRIIVIHYLPSCAMRQKMAYNYVL